MTPALSRALSVAASVPAVVVWAVLVTGWTVRLLRRTRS